MTHLHQVIAMERGAVTEAEKKLAEIKHILAIGGDNDPLTGLSKVYESRFGEDGDKLPAQNRRVQLTVAELLGHAKAHLTRLFDVKFTREFGNTEARADIVVDGTLLVADVPAGYLLFLETEITKLITGLIDKLPALNPAEEWVNDPTQPVGVWKSAVRQIEKTKRVPQVQVLYDATPEHPAQVRPYETDIIEGYWTQVKFSGQLPAREIQAIRARALKVREAVLYAREQANTLTVQDRKAGDVLLGYILGG